MIDLVDGDYSKAWLDAAVGSRVIGMDIETNGLDPSVCKIATVQMSVPNIGTVMVRNIDRNPVNLLQLLESRQTTKIFHHAPFDLGFLMRHFTVYPEKIACTKVAAKVLDPKRKKFFDPDTNKGSHSLKSLVYHYFGFKMDKSIAVSDWFADDLSQEQLEYAAKDVEYLPDLLRNLEIELAYESKIRLARKTMSYIPTTIMLQIKNYEDIY